MSIEVQRPRTAEEIAALPIGGDFGWQTYDITDADRQRGYAEINGQHVVVRPGIQHITIPTLPDSVLFFSEMSDATHYIDTDDYGWSLGRTADGRWFRHLER